MDSDNFFRFLSQGIASLILAAAASGIGLGMLRNYPRAQKAGKIITYTVSIIIIIGSIVLGITKTITTQDPLMIIFFPLGGLIGATSVLVIYGYLTGEKSIVDAITKNKKIKKAK